MSWGYNGRPDKPWQPKPGMCKHRVTRQDAHEMLRLRREGMSLLEIGDIFRVSYGTVRWHLLKLLTPKEYARLSLECRRRGRVGVTKSDRNAQIVEMRRKRKSQKEIAAALGCSVSVVADICNRLLPIEETEALSLRRRAV
jgi:DNA-binding CsgD family transcriptional regulator